MGETRAALLLAVISEAAAKLGYEHIDRTLSDRTRTPRGTVTKKERNSGGTEVARAVECLW